MFFFFSCKIKHPNVVLLFRKYLLLSLSLCLLSILTSCGQAFFPIELKTVSRSERLQNQENKDVRLVAMTEKTVIEANRDRYIRRVIDAGDLNRAARFIPVEKVIKEFLPVSTDPGLYKLGVGDVITFGQIFFNNGRTLVTRKFAVNEDGTVNIVSLGRIKVLGKTLSQLEDTISQRLVEEGIDNDFEVMVSGFNSKRILTVHDGAPVSIPYTS